MQISFERTGGFAGITKKTTIDTDTLSPNEASTLAQLVEVADLFRLPEHITSPNQESDRFQYKLIVEDNGKQHTVTVSEASLPETLKPLVEWLQTLGTKKVKNKKKK
ncbi:protealysin inhibitor emfourin [Nostoc sp.]|uniref:protealysin inhibitor emfourin n=1 Tax=Nostoc sp. TaxID=1180 RepID=UPI002FF91D99